MTKVSDVRAAEIKAYGLRAEELAGGDAALEVTARPKIEGIDEIKAKAEKLVETINSAKSLAGELADLCKDIKVTAQVGPAETHSVETAFERHLEKVVQDVAEWYETTTKEIPTAKGRLVFVKEDYLRIIGSLSGVMRKING